VKLSHPYEHWPYTSQSAYTSRNFSQPWCQAVIWGLRLGSPDRGLRYPFSTIDLRYGTFHDIISTFSAQKSIQIKFDLRVLSSNKACNVSIKLALTSACQSAMATQFLQLQQYTAPEWASVLKLVVCQRCKGLTCCISLILPAQYQQSRMGAKGQRCTNGHRQNVWQRSFS